LAPSDFHLFGLLKNHLGGRRFADDEEDETEVRKWLGQQSKDFYAAGFNTLVKQWDKYINVGGGYVEKWMFFQVRISRVLRFISICDSDCPLYTMKAYKLIHLQIKCLFRI
jgi:hypothetical protein